MTKQKVMQEIERKAECFQKTSAIQYRIRCPICGDSQKNLRDAHCYIKCSYDPAEPILYICFKCNARGMVGRQFLEKLGCNGDILNSVGSQRFNRITALKKANINIITGDPVMESNQARYVRKRLGKVPDWAWPGMKIVWDLGAVYPYITDRKVRNTMPNNRDSISFLSDDKSTLLTRFFDDVGGRWRKIKLFPSDGKSMYTIGTQFDLFKTTLYDQEGWSDLCIAEGVMDIISVYINEEMSKNSAYIAVLGSDYVAGVEHAIVKGIFGSSIRLHVYIDDDVDEKELRKKLLKYKWLYHSIEICRNTKFKDMGTTPDNIRVSRRLI